MYEWRWIREMCLGWREVLIVRWHKCGFKRVTDASKGTLGYGCKVKEKDDTGVSGEGKRS